ncbi:MAG: YdcF family protein [Cyclobacteriaceae bacterium]|nr:YdcF family protein [Cyclobacteriaceae bacterium]
MSVFSMVLFCSTPLPQWLVYNLESKYKVINTETIQTTDSAFIVVLGGGHTLAPGLPSIDQLSMDALSRLAEGIRLYRLIPGSKLVCSGSSLTKRTTQAELLALSAIELGVPAVDTLLSTSAENTAQEIEAIVKKLGNQQSIILVTSAIHMPRAMSLCVKYGLSPIPAPASHLMKKDPLVSIYDFTPSYHKIMLMHRAMHEYAGMMMVNF